MSIHHAVLLVGSAKPAGASTSEVLGRYVTERMAKRGVSTSVLFVGRSVAQADRELIETLADADLFILASPLYVDSFPYLVTRALENVAAALRPPRKRRAFAAIVNCGFPEAEHCQTALAIAQAFARRADFTWAGGLAVGEGPALNGQPLEGFGRLTRRLRAGLDLAAADLAVGRPVSAAAVQDVAGRMMPSRLYTVAGNHRWRRMAARNRATAQLSARPFSID
jgi:hypothetical protein